MSRPGAPIWLLDIDGVLNATQVVPRSGYVAADADNISVRYRPELMRRISALHEAGLVDLRWLTTWMRTADHFAVTCGLPVGLPVVGLPWFHTASSDEWWKAEAAREVAEANPARLLIWTDDDLEYSYGSGDLDWVIGRPMVRVSPSPEVGLTDADLDAIEHACRAVALLPAAAPVVGGAA